MCPCFSDHSLSVERGVVLKKPVDTADPSEPQYGRDLVIREPLRP